MSRLLIVAIMLWWWIIEIMVRRLIIVDMVRRRIVAILVRRRTIAIRVCLVRQRIVANLLLLSEYLSLSLNLRCSQIVCFVMSMRLMRLVISLCMTILLLDRAARRRPSVAVSRTVFLV